ncbi:hypothetical protein H8356DRAFT_1299853 [Neocallimastix lanati (nom. inval.)]|uniref:Uncharacterized protein n=1 Tax=Neocallimastix californiae TaxID=1754190 RepID=A0A1Y1YHP2_9FUNG|nr:hypothetical protein H8356DRAFT_1299853 [Neocallimastix sp. JGI-2020a]ORX97134.1 hypothetical protein LY90DRAFT_520135 [Neocallimastix californiae]ORY10607.1 hypothetical protein LY90DRAFT_677981 [Neocallimastix californiae]|eukprot:ORX97134.1 hypothetical protein LY90DRAFT_520135 [Neocallimastix californiae]
MNIVQSLCNGLNTKNGNGSQNLPKNNTMENEVKEESVLQSLTKNNTKENEIKESKEFCLYNSEGVIKIYDPIYRNNKGKLVHAETIEEYAKVLGPTWYGVSFCNNNTLVNSLGMYFDISNSKLHKRSEEETPVNDDNIFRGENPLLESDYETITTKYIDNIYEELKNSEKKCMPLTSVSPGFNPYHKSLTIGIDNNNEPANIRFALGGFIKVDKKDFDDLPSGITKCNAVRSCKGCNVVCSAIITASIEKQYSVTNSNGVTHVRTYGQVEGSSDTETQDISSTMEVANSLTDSGSITQTSSNSTTNSLEKSIAIQHTDSNSNSDEQSATHTDEFSKSNIKGVTEENTHATTVTDTESKEQNWSDYTEHSNTEEYSHLSWINTGCNVGQTVGSLWSAYEAHESNKISRESMAQEEKIAKNQYNQTDYWNIIQSNQTDFWNTRQYNQTDYWNIRQENQTDFWNLRTEQMQYNLANYDLDVQDYLAQRQESFQLRLALAGTRTSSTTDVEGHSEGGAIINSHEVSNYVSKTTSVLNQEQTTNGYSDAYSIGHTETSTVEDSKTDTISDLLSSSNTKEESWSIDHSKSITNTNSKTFGSSNSQTQSKEVSLEESKNISYENTIGKIVTNGKSYQINQAITNNPGDNKCYSYIIAPKIKSEAIIWACKVNDEYSNDKVKFVNSESMVKFYENEFIINRTDCSNNNNVKGIKLLDNYTSNRLFFNDRYKNFLLSNEELTIGSCISSGAPSSETGDYLWFFGLLPNGQLALCQSQFDEKHAVWSSSTLFKVKSYEFIKKLDLRFKIANNGHLIIEGHDLLKYKKLSSDLYSVDTSQYVVVWDSLPKSLPFNVGFYGNTGYTLMINPLDDGADCEVILVDSLNVIVWRITSKTTTYHGYSFPLEYNIPLIFDTEKIDYDPHNRISKNVKTLYTSEIKMDCNTKLKENEALVSKNGKYKMYLQPSGNIVLKQNERTLWSTQTALMESFSSPFHIAFSAIGDMVLRDRYNHVLWHTINPYCYEIFNINKEDIYTMAKNNNIKNECIQNLGSVQYRLVLDDSGELQILDNNNNMVWSNLFVRNFNLHMRYVEPLVYAITSCNEVLRLPRVSELHSYPSPETNALIVNTPYYNNLLPDEKLVSSYDNKVSLNMEHKLIIMNMVTHKIEWGYNPVKFLDRLDANVEHINKHGEIDVANNFTLYDRLYSIRNDNSYAYMSNKYGLQLPKKGGFISIYELKINNNNFVINKNIVVDHIKNMKLEYDSLPNALILSNSTTNIWKYHGSLYCNKLFSDNEDCNSVYSFTPVYRDNNDPWLHLVDGALYKYNNLIYNITKDINTDEVIYSFSVNKDGSIGINNNKFIIHKEYYRVEKNYVLELYDENINNLKLVLKSSEGEIKWSNRNVSNRPYNASEIKVGESFKEGEMLYCGDYSMAILNGKLLYRDHKKQTSTEIKNYGGNKSAYLYKIIIGNNSLTFRDKNNEDIDNILSNKKSNNSRLRCDKSNHGIVWDNGNNQILWKYSSTNSFNPKSDAVWLYNKYYNKCLYTSGFKNEPITYEDCVDHNKYKWYFEKIDGNTYFISAAKHNLCMRVIKNRMTLGECDEKAILKYIKASKSIKSGNKCLSGIDDNDDPYSQYELKLSSCNRHDEKQMWEFISDISYISN